MPESSSQSAFRHSTASTEMAISLSLGVGAMVGSLLTRYWIRRAGTSSSSSGNPLQPLSNRLSQRPLYTPGQTPAAPSANFGKKVHILDPSKLKSSYNLIISTVTPRPIALVSSRHPTTKIDNLSPFSYFGAVAHDPPMLAVGFCRDQGNMKDTLVNLKLSKHCVVNIISEWYLDAANHSCGRWPKEVDEFKKSGLTKGATSDSVEAPRVAQAAVSYECVLEHLHPVATKEKGATTEIALLKVLKIHVDDTVLDPNAPADKPAVDTMKLRPMSRLGGNIYSTLGEMADIPRPKV